MIGKSIFTFIMNATLTDGALGFFSAFYSQNIEGYRDPNSVNGYSYNDSDGKWYETRPSPDYGQFEWENPASVADQNRFNGIRDARKINNNMLELTEENAGDKSFPKELFDELRRRAKKWMDDYGDFFDGLPSALRNQSSQLSISS